jgi:diguanylate cyclase (GGDEF)-like protein
MKFVPPVLFLLFGAAFVGVWALERKLRFAVTLAAAFWTLALAMLSQVVGVPPDGGHNALVSGALYAAAMLLVGDWMQRRSGEWFPASLAALYLVGIVGGLWYFYYVDRNLIVRVYILNFGMGLILLHSCWLARSLLRGSWTDKALFWLLALFGFHFIPRTFFTIGSVVRRTTPQEFAQTEFWQTVVLTTSVIGAAGGLCLLGILVVDIVSKLRHERDLDPLTGLFNRRGLERHAGGVRDARPGHTRVVVVCDLDRFKAINDTYGHDVGDAVLTAFAGIIRENVRKDDVVARTGGEEFVLVLERISELQAFALAERIRKAVEKTRFHGVRANEPVTCSFGLAAVAGGEPFWSSLKRADKALYEAKRRGRNQTCPDWDGSRLRNPDLTEVLGTPRVQPGAKTG